MLSAIIMKNVMLVVIMLFSKKGATTLNIMAVTIMTHSIRFEY